MPAPAVDPATQGIDVRTRQHTSGAHLAVLISRALEVAGRLANDAAEVIMATAGRGALSTAGVSVVGLGTPITSSPVGPSAPYDWVTDTGRTLERHTRRVLSSDFPQVPVLGQGSADNFGSPCLPGDPDGPDVLWVVDPVDGTTNYLAGLPWCAYSLALLDCAGPLVGVVADPYQSQIYAAARGRGLRANGRPVEPSEPPSTLTGALICCEFTADHPALDPPAFVRRSRQAQVSLRMLGSPALAITQVALGRAAAAVLPTYDVWDVAGAVALAHQAGAWVGGFDGRPHPLPRNGLVVCSATQRDAVFDLLTG